MKDEQMQGGMDLAKGPDFGVETPWPPPGLYRVHLELVGGKQSRVLGEVRVRQPGIVNYLPLIGSSSLPQGAKLRLVRLMTKREKLRERTDDRRQAALEARAHAKPAPAEAGVKPAQRRRLPGSLRIMAQVAASQAVHSKAQLLRKQGR